MTKSFLNVSRGVTGLAKYPKKNFLFTPSLLSETLRSHFQAYNLPNVRIEVSTYSFSACSSGEAALACLEDGKSA